MLKNKSLSKNSSLRLTTQKSLRHLGMCSQTATGQQTSPVIFPEKRGSAGNAAGPVDSLDIEGYSKVKQEEHRIDIRDEQSDLLGCEVYSGKLSLDKRKSRKNPDVQTSVPANLDDVDAKLTSKAFIWGSNVLHLDDIISLSFCVGLRHFTVHAFPLRKCSCGLFMKSRRSRKDFRFFASTSEQAIQWVNALADQQCYVNRLPHPMASMKQSSELIFSEFPSESYIRCKCSPKMLVILNPRSGRGSSSKVFHGMVEPIFKLAGFELEVVRTKSAGHARKLAASVDFITYPDGIICVGGDGIINEVLNGLLSRENKKEAFSIPIGIIPTGSDNSLVWTVLGVRDPISAAVSIIKGGVTPTDVFATEWIHSGAIHFGMTVTYFGFISDVLELSETYQKRFGPLRYFVAGVLKFLCLPNYNYEVEYLPARREAGGQKESHDSEIIDMQELYNDIMHRSKKELHRSASLSSIDTIMTLSQMSEAECDTTCSSNEPSEHVRAIDPKSKRLSATRSNVTSEPEVIHPQNRLSCTPNWLRTRSKSRMEHGSTAHDKEDISSTLSDPGLVWDAEPRWDVETPIELSGPLQDSVAGDKKDAVPSSEEKWIATKGQFLAVLVCNHSCKTVQSLSSQVVAPKAQHDDNMLDLLLVRGRGRLKLLRFLLLLQIGRHLSLPYVEYVKVKSVKIKPGKGTHNGCGIDGELFPVNGEVICSLLQEQCRVMGRSPSHNNK